MEVERLLLQIAHTMTDDSRITTLYRTREVCSSSLSGFSVVGCFDIPLLIMIFFCVKIFMIIILCVLSTLGENVDTCTCFISPGR